MKSILLSAGLLAYGLSQIINAGNSPQIDLKAYVPPMPVAPQIHVDPMPINVNPTVGVPPKIDPFFAFRSGCTGAISSDIVINGNFSDNKCNKQWCEYDAKSYKNEVNGWVPSPVMQIGWAYLYNNEISNQNNRVMELDASGNSCITQKLNVKPGRYLLEYDWAARVGLPLETSKMSVYLNNKVIQSHTPPDYHVQHRRYAFTADKDNQIDLTFCAQGVSDGLGAIIDNVHVFSLDQCQLYVPPK